MNRLKRRAYEYLITQVFDEFKEFEDLYYLPYLNPLTRYRIVRKMSKPNWKAKTRKYITDLINHNEKKRKKK